MSDTDNLPADQGTPPTPKPSQKSSGTAAPSQKPAKTPLSSKEQQQRKEKKAKRRSKIAKGAKAVLAALGLLGATGAAAATGKRKRTQYDDGRGEGESFKKRKLNEQWDPESANQASGEAALDNKANSDRKDADKTDSKKSPKTDKEHDEERRRLEEKERQNNTPRSGNGNNGSNGGGGNSGSGGGGNSPGSGIGGGPSSPGRRAGIGAGIGAGIIAPILIPGLIPKPPHNPSKPDDPHHPPAPPLTLQSLSQDTGDITGDNEILLTGTGFTSVAAAYFGTIMVVPYELTATTCKVKTPLHDAGPVQVTVASSSETSNALTFTYLPLDNPKPVIPSEPAYLNPLSPSSGSRKGGYEVQVSGSNFKDVTTIQFGNTRLPIQIAPGSNQFILDKVPPSVEPDTVDVFLINSDGTESNRQHFVYTAALVPRFQNVSPSSGFKTGHYPATLTGQDFQDVTTVLFDNQSHPFTRNGNQISIQIPASAEFKAITIQLVNSEEVRSEPQTFTYIPFPKPNITGLSRTSGPIEGGYDLIITGTDFERVIGAQLGRAYIPLQGNSVGQFTLTVPAIPAAQAGAVSIYLLASDNQQSDPRQFIYEASTENPSDIGRSFKYSKEQYAAIGGLIGGVGIATGVGFYRHYQQEKFRKKLHQEAATVFEGFSHYSCILKTIRFIAPDLSEHMIKNPYEGDAYAQFIAYFASSFVALTHKDVLTKLEAATQAAKNTNSEFNLETYIKDRLELTLPPPRSSQAHFGPKEAMDSMGLAIEFSIRASLAEKLLPIISKQHPQFLDADSLYKQSVVYFELAEKKFLEACQAFEVPTLISHLKEELISLKAQKLFEAHEKINEALSQQALDDLKASAQLQAKNWGATLSQEKIKGLIKEDLIAYEKLLQETDTAVQNAYTATQYNSATGVLEVIDKALFTRQEVFRAALQQPVNIATAKRRELENYIGTRGLGIKQTMIAALLMLAAGDQQAKIIKLLLGAAIETTVMALVTAAVCSIAEDAKPYALQTRSSIKSNLKKLIEALKELPHAPLLELHSESKADLPIAAPVENNSIGSLFTRPAIANLDEEQLYSFLHHSVAEGSVTQMMADCMQESYLISRSDTTQPLGVSLKTSFMVALWGTLRVYTRYELAKQHNATQSLNAEEKLAFETLEQWREECLRQLIECYAKLPGKLFFDRQGTHDSFNSLLSARTSQIRIYQHTDRPVDLLGTKKNIAPWQNETKNRLYHGEPVHSVCKHCGAPLKISDHFKCGHCNFDLTDFNPQFNHLLDALKVDQSLAALDTFSFRSALLLGLIALLCFIFPPAGLIALASNIAMYALYMPSILGVFIRIYQWAYNTYYNAVKKKNLVAFLIDAINTIVSSVRLFLPTAGPAINYFFFALDWTMYGVSTIFKSLSEEHKAQLVDIDYLAEKKKSLGTKLAAGYRASSRWIRQVRKELPSYREHFENLRAQYQKSQTFGPQLMKKLEAIQLPRHLSSEHISAQYEILKAYSKAQLSLELSNFIQLLEQKNLREIIRESNHAWLFGNTKFLKEEEINIPTSSQAKPASKKRPTAEEKNTIELIPILKHEEESYAERLKKHIDHINHAYLRLGGDNERKPYKEAVLQANQLSNMVELLPYTRFEDLADPLTFQVHIVYAIRNLKQKSSAAVQTEASSLITSIPAYLPELKERITPILLQIKVFREGYLTTLKMSLEEAPKTLSPSERERHSWHQHRVYLNPQIEILEACFKNLGEIVLSLIERILTTIAQGDDLPVTSLTHTYFCLKSLRHFLKQLIESIYAFIDGLETLLRKKSTYEFRIENAHWAVEKILHYTSQINTAKEHLIELVGPLPASRPLSLPNAPLATLDTSIPTQKYIILLTAIYDELTRGHQSAHFEKLVTELEDIEKLQIHDELDTLPDVSRDLMTHLQALLFTQQSWPTTERLEPTKALLRIELRKLDYPNKQQPALCRQFWFEEVAYLFETYPPTSPTARFEFEARKTWCIANFADLFSVRSPITHAPPSHPKELQQLVYLTHKALQAVPAEIAIESKDTLEAKGSDLSTQQRAATNAARALHTFLQQPHPPTVTVARYENLIFEGGGVKGFAYLGALQEATQSGPQKLKLFDFSDIKRVGGSSAGAITAMLVGLGYSLTEINHISGFRPIENSPLPIVNFLKLLDSPYLLNPNNLKQLRERHWLLTALSLPALLSKGSYFHQHLGFCQGKIARNLFEQLIYIKSGIHNATFEELYHLGFKAMYFIGVNLTRGKTAIFSYETTPKLIVADAVRISMGIPVVFEPHRLHQKDADGVPRFSDDDLYVDGALQNNYPIELFDKEKYVHPDSRSDDYAFNPRTLGFRLISGERKPESTSEKITGIFAFLGKLWNAFYNVQEAQYRRGENHNSQRTIYLEPKYSNQVALNAMDFDKMENPDIQANVFNSGQVGVDEFRGKIPVSSSFIPPAVPLAYPHTDVGISTKTTIENLIFEGGGIRGLAFLGALQTATQDADYALFSFDTIQRVAGASAGAITALLIGLGFSLREIKHIYRFAVDPELTAANLPSIHFFELLDSAYGRTIFNLHSGKTWNIAKGVFNLISSAGRKQLSENFGLCPGEVAVKLFDDLIAFRLKALGLPHNQPLITFEDLHSLQPKNQKRLFKDCYFIGVNLTKCRTEIFSYEHTPDMSIADAVRISMGIPLVFNPHKLRKTVNKINTLNPDDLYVDGSLHLRYPISLFDQAKYLPQYNSLAAQKNPEDRIINPHTLGFRLVPRQTTDYFPRKMEPWDLFKQLMDALYNSQETLYEQHQEKYHPRTIYITPEYVDAQGARQELKMMDFDKMEADDIRAFVFVSGQEAVVNYYSEHRRSHSTVPHSLATTTPAEASAINTEPFAALFTDPDSSLEFKSTSSSAAAPSRVPPRSTPAASNTVLFGPGAEETCQCPHTPGLILDLHCPRCGLPYP